MINLDMVKEVNSKDICDYKKGDLSEEAFDYVHNEYGINCCDRCMRLDLSEQLYWIDDVYGEDERDNYLSRMYTSVCWCCMKELEELRPGEEVKRIFARALDKGLITLDGHATNFIENFIYIGFYKNGHHFMHLDTEKFITMTE